MIPIRPSVMRELLDGANRAYLGLTPARTHKPSETMPAAQAETLGHLPASRPLVHDAGVWKGIALDDWCARFAGRTDDHAGARPTRYGGPRRRRSDRLIQPTERTAA